VRALSEKHMRLALFMADRDRGVDGDQSDDEARSYMQHGTRRTRSNAIANWASSIGIGALRNNGLLRPQSSMLTRYPLSLEWLY